MKLPIALLLAAATLAAQGSLRGVVTDPSGAAAPNAAVEATGPGGAKRVRSDTYGQYSFARLATGRYTVRVMAKGFAVATKEVAVDGAAECDFRLTIQTAPQSVSVEGRGGRLGTEPEQNGSARVLGEREIAALSDDPDELALQLQALAGPAPGPDGGQFYIDGFSGGALPAKSSIREVRVNANPFSPEFDLPGFSRVDIFTKAGGDALRGQAMAQGNTGALDTRNPLLTAKPAYRAQLYSASLAGPLRKNRASFTIDLQARKIDDNAFILAATPTGKLNQTFPTPQSRTSLSPRVDYAPGSRNNLTVRYQQLWTALDNLGVGGFNLPSQAYRETERDETAQITETATLSPRTVNETRFQYWRTSLQDSATDTSPAIVVVGAFTAGGSPVNQSGTVTGNWELSNLTIHTSGRHTLKWGGRARDARLTDTSRNNFAGTFTFYSLTQYEAGFAAQFSRNAGDPVTAVHQADLGIFAGDDWRARPNLTLSFGLRYEAQSHLGGSLDFAPRAAIAWALGKATVVRAGAGTFYNRIPIADTLNRLRYNGVTQQSYLILNPAFFPTVPAVAALAQQPQELRPVAAGLLAGRLYQASAGIERQFNRKSRAALTFVESRGAHLPDSRNINTPVGGRYPYGDPSLLLLQESSGESWQRQLLANANIEWRGLFLFGMYTLSYGRDDNEGLPADPYHLRAEWGPSSYGDLRHRGVLGATIPLPGKWSVSPFFLANSGTPYNITTGLDPALTGAPFERPALLPNLSAAQCPGIYAAAFGCFDLNPRPGAPTIERNFARGPANVNLALRVARTWQFGPEGGGGTVDSASAGHTAMPAGMFPTRSTRRYQLTLSASTLNALNRANYAPPDGDLSSGYFGQYRGLGGLAVMTHGGGASAYNRKIDLALQFNF